MWMYTERGKVPVDVTSSITASRVSRYQLAVERALDLRREAPLAQFRGKSISIGKVRYPFITDLPTLRRLAQASELSAEGPYRQI
jgi:hypothetical protein